VIAAEDERDHPAVGGVPDLLCDALARLPDLRKKAGVSIAGVDRLPDVREDVPPILRGDPERLEPLAETGVADRRRPHVDPAPAAPRSSSAPMIATRVSAATGLS